MYRIEKDYGEAVKWYTKAAQQGHAFAQNDLGMMYENGEGVEKDYGEAGQMVHKSRPTRTCQRTE